jgi:hypothetical protein
MGSVKFCRGTKEQFDQLEEIDPDTLYFLSVEKEISETDSEPID